MSIPPGWTPEQARKRLDAATPGPWREESRTSIGTETTNVAIICDGGQTYESFEGNRAFIANAPQDIAALLALLGEAREALERVRNDWSFLFNLHENVTLDPRVRRALADYNLKTLDALLSRLAAPEDGA